MFGMGESMTFSSYRPTCRAGMSVNFCKHLYPSDIRFNIHIKTSSTGGETKHGYPDATYFQRPKLRGAVTEHCTRHAVTCRQFFPPLGRSLSELKANGVNLMDLRS